MGEFKQCPVRLDIKLILFFILAQSIGLAGAQHELANARGQEYVNWDKIMLDLRTYELCPSEENAKRLLGRIPPIPPIHELGEKELAGLAIINSDRFWKALIDGDEILAEGTFRLLGQMKGGVIEEELTIMLGRFLIIKPTVFLRLLRKYSHLFPSERDYPVTMTEIMEIVPNIVSHDDVLLRKKEETRLFKERIRALESVKDPELIGLRDACVRIIKKKIVGLFPTQSPSFPPD